MAATEVDPSGASNQASFLGSAGQEAGAKLKNLLNVLQANGVCWGDDETGQAFAKNYVKGAQDTLNGLAALAKVFGLSEGDVKKTAKSFESLDEAAATTTKTA